MDRADIVDTFATVTLAEIVKREVALYQGISHISQLYALLDDENQRYGIIVVENDRSLEVPVWVFVMARIVENYVVIEEDTSAEKHLFEALIHNGGIPRDRVILAYKGETLPEQTHS